MPSRPDDLFAAPPVVANKIETIFDNGPPRVVDIWNGDDKLGSVAVGRSIRAVTSDGIEIGRFATFEEARAAIVRHAFGNAAHGPLSGGAS